MIKNRKWPYVTISVIFTLFLLLPIFVIPMWNFVQNPNHRYRADSATSTGYTILIDEHYQVHTTSGERSILSYTEEARKINASDLSTSSETLSQTVNRLNWNDEYLIISAKGSKGNESFMIINRTTNQKQGYPNKKEFEAAKEEKGLNLSLKNKKAFDWY